MHVGFLSLCFSSSDISFQFKEAGTPSTSSLKLIEAPFSSTSALLAQLKLNNPKVAETHPVQERVSYEHVDSKRGVLHLSMHMHNMCGSLGMLWACGRDLGTSQASRFSSTSAPLAQVKLNHPEVAETRPTHGRVSYKCVAAPPWHVRYTWQP
ncbi:hypothetical protein GQ457_18G009640 [Hibiscus cannabinus]